MHSLVSLENIAVICRLFLAHLPTLIFYLCLAAIPLIALFIISKCKTKLSRLRINQLICVEAKGFFFFIIFLVLSIFFSELEKAKDESVISFVNSITSIIDLITSVLVPTFTKTIAYYKTIK